jgi:hypothetical protein
MTRLLTILALGSIVMPALAAPAPAGVPARWEGEGLSPSERGATGRRATAARLAARQPLLGQDARLETAVTLRLRESPLAAVVAEIGRQAGVAMKAAPEVAEERAIVVATDQPAKEVMHHLASLFHYRWTRRGEPGRYAYELFQDLRSQQEEEALRQQQRRRALAALQAALRERWQLAQRPPEQLCQEAAVHAAAVAEFELLPEEQRFAARATPAFRALQQRSAWSFRLREMADPFQRALCRLTLSLTPAHWNALVTGETVQLGTQWEWGRLDSLPTDGAGLRVSVRLDLTSEPGGTQAVLSVTPTTPMPAGSEGASPLPGLMVPARAVSTPEGPASPAALASWAGDPVLGAKRRFPLALSAAAAPDEVGSLNQILSAIAESYGINLVADADRTDAGALPELPAGEERALYEVLDRYVLPHARWSREGPFVHVRRHDSGGAAGRDHRNAQSE